MNKINRDIMQTTWENKLREECQYKGFFAPELPESSFWRSVKYHLWHRWKNLRFGFYFKREERDDD